MIPMILRSTLLVLWVAVFSFSPLVIPPARGADTSPETLIKAGHWKRALSLVQQRLAANQHDADALYFIARFKQRTGDSDGAQLLAEKACALDSRNAKYHFLLSEIYGDKAEKASVFRQPGLARQFKKEAETTIALDPSHIDARMYLIEYYERAPGIIGGDKAKARTMADEIMKIDPVRGYLAQARLAVLEKQSEKIEGLYRKAVEAGPNNFEAVFALSNHYRSANPKKNDLAEQVLAEAAASNPKDYQTLMTIAGFYGSDDIKKYDLAEKYLRDALKLDSDRVGAHSGLAQLLALQERWQELDDAIVQAEKCVPDNLHPYYQAGNMLLRTGKDLPRAERYFRKYLTQDPEPGWPLSAHAHWRLGLVLEKQGRKPEAIPALETAVRLKPDLDAAKKDLKRLK